MQSKFNIGDSVMIRGIVRRIEVTKEGVIYYDVENESDVLGAYGYNRVEESEIERMEEKKDDSVY